MLTESTELSQLKRALVALKEMRGRLDAIEKARTEPIAIIGMGCRFPGGANSPAAFWQLLRDGVDAVTEVPRSRWDADALYDDDPEMPGKSNTRYGAFLEDVDQFDPAFFGISPREARQMDPQQRLLLETAVEALERAGLPLEQVAGSTTGVFVGAHSHSNEYSWLQYQSLDSIDAHSSSGTAHSILANRLSYVFDWKGPSLSVDTACSSSLVAIHLAVNSLRSGECDAALAAGVNLLLAPETFLTMSKLQALSPDGRCKTFDASANGFGRGEGCGVVVLKRLADAQAAGDPIAAVIRGTAVNQDGSTNGLTAPNGLSQQAVIRQALADGGVEPETISYIEAHGTGTVLGDPIEVEALAEALGRDGSETCYLSSVKTNIGHLEGAAGIAGLIKTVLALQHNEIPPHLHFQELNPHISFAGTRFAIPTVCQPWPSSDQPRRAGISSFGFGGTNAHIVLEEVPAPDAASQAEALVLYLLPLSARSEAALQAVVQRYADYLEATETPLADICYTAVQRRNHHTRRLVVMGRSHADLAGKLRQFAQDKPHPDVVEGTAVEQQQGVVFVFSGQGADLLGMGQELLVEEPIFRAVIEKCDALLRQYADWSLLEELTAVSHLSRLEQNEVAQPALFAVQVALAALWQSWGIVPEAVIGHSLGEVSAACVAGALSLEDALRVVFHRGRVLAEAAGLGTMAAVGLSRDEVNALLVNEKDVSLAVVNSSDSIVLSGDRNALERIVSNLKAQDKFARLLSAVNYPSHSLLMEPFSHRLETALSGLHSQAPQIPVFSTSRGAWAAADDFDAGYWGRNIRRPVLFADGITQMVADGYRTFVEISHHPMLNVPIQQTGGDQIRVVESLRHNQPETAVIRRNLALLYTQGAVVDWSQLYPQGRVADLPTYPWQRQRYWLDTPQKRRDVLGTAAAHPLLGNRVRSPLPTYEIEINVQRFPFLSEHRVGETVILPTTLFVEMALAAAHETWGSGDYQFSNLSIQEALAFDTDETRTVQLVLTKDDGEARFHCFSLQANDEWMLHAQGTLQPIASPQPRPLLDKAVRERCQEVAAATHYEAIAARNLHFGPLFQGIVKLWRGEHEALAQIQLPLPDADDFRSRILLLDACLQPLITTMSGEELYLLIGIEQLPLSHLPAEVWSHARLRPLAAHQTETVTGDVSFYDAEGQLVGMAMGVLLKRANAASLRRLAGRSDHLHEWLYDVVWEVKPLQTGEKLRTLDQIVGGMNGRLPAFAQTHDADAFLKVQPHLEALSLDYARQALAELGWPFQTDSHFTLDEAAVALNVVPHYHRLLQQLLDMLTVAGDLGVARAGWVVVNSPMILDDLAARHQQVWQQFAAARTELDLVGRCGPHLTAVLRGEVDPLELLFPEGSSDTLTAFYRESSFARLPNELMGEMVQQVVENAQKPLRILEIGAGTGGTTASILPHLPPDCDYVFSDISPLFVERARTELSDYPFVRFATLDLDNSPVAQGFTGSFDLVIAANVLHATVDVRRSLHHVRELLAPGGLLLALEIARPQNWMNVTFGLMAGWWHFTDDDLRQRTPLLEVEQWQLLLTAAGLQEVSVVVPAPELPALFLAREPETDTSDYWLVFADEGGVGAELASLLREQQKTVVLVYAGDDYVKLSDGIALDPMQPRHFMRLLVEGEKRPLRQIIYLWALDAANHKNDPAWLTTGALHLSQALQKHSGSQLWLITRHAQAIAGEAPEVAQSVLWGFGRVLALEQPQVWGGLIDVDHDNVGHDNVGHVNAAARILAEVTHADDEDQIVWRGDMRLVVRLQRATPLLATPVRWGPGAYLLTGGLGGLGLKLAHGLAERGVRHLVLTSRSGLPPRQEWDTVKPESEIARRIAAVREIEAMGAEVTAVSLDVSDELSMKALFQRFGGDLPSLHSVFHMAAAIDFIPLAEMQPDDLHAMFRAKVSGSWLLHQLTQEMDLEHFVLFSSTTALWGVNKMAHYAAANTFLDALAHLRKAQGLPALSINWGTWEEMRVTSQAEQEEIAGFGLRPMPVDLALDILERLLNTDTAQKVVSDVDWSLLKPAYEVRRKRPFLTHVGAPIAKPVATRSISTLHEALARAEPHEQYDILLDYIAGQVTAVMGYDGQQQLNTQQGLFDLGMDSLMAVELRNRLEKATGKSLPATLIFNYPSVAALVAYLADNVVQLNKPADAADPSAEKALETTGVDDAIPEDLLALFDNELGQIDDLLNN